MQTKYQVIVVTPDNKAVFRPVKVGDRVGTNWIITEGLKPGEKVVVEGILKVQQVRQRRRSWRRKDSGHSQAVYAPARGTGGREQLTMSKFFINRPIVAIVISILMVLVGVVCDAQPADGAVSQHR